VTLIFELDLDRGYGNGELARQKFRSEVIRVKSYCPYTFIHKTDTLTHWTDYSTWTTKVVGKSVDN